MLILKIVFLQKFRKLIRIVEQQDWVIYCIVGVILSYLILFKTLHRNVSLVEFLFQPYENTNNNILSWFFTTLLFSVSFSVLFSQYIPVVPKFISENISFFGFQFNKFGFILTSLLLFYLIKNILVYLFYGSIQELKKFGKYSFVAQKYYLVYSFVFLLLSFIHYYLPVDKHKIFTFYVLISIIAFALKLLLYLFHNQRILPEEWYYKILYICTLQILPSLLIWKFWFF